MSETEYEQIAEKEIKRIALLREIQTEIEKEIKQYGQKIKKLLDQINKSEIQRKELDLKQKEQEDIIKKNEILINSFNDKYNQAIKDKQKQLADLGIAIENSKKELKEISKGIDKAKNEKVVVKIDKQILMKEATLKYITKEIMEQQNKINDIKQQIIDLEKQKKKLEDEIMDIEEIRSHLKTQFESEKMQYEKDLNDLLEKIQKAQSELEDTKYRILANIKREERVEALAQKVKEYYAKAGIQVDL